MHTRCLCYNARMIGLFLVLASTFFTETQDSIGKRTVSDGRPSIYPMGFLNLMWGFLFFLVIIFVRQSFVFSLASLPTFVPRLLLEIVLAHVAVLAITRADRSTFSLIRIGTIPLLLFADIMLGYAIGMWAFIGLGVIILVLLFAFSNQTIGKKGIGLVATTALLAAVTLSLYKYDITHFNSVEAEQSLIIGALLVYFFLMARFSANENPLRFLRQPVFLMQSLSAGLAELLMSFAYLFGTAAVITAAKRAFAVLFGVISGQMYFKEKHLAAKLVISLFLIVGLVLLAVSH